MKEDELTTFEDQDLVWFVYASGRAKATGAFPKPETELSPEDMRFFSWTLKEARGYGLKLAE